MTTDCLEWDSLSARRQNLSGQTQSPSDMLADLSQWERFGSLCLYSPLRFWRLLVSDKPTGLDTVAMVTDTLRVVAYARGYCVSLFA